MHNQYPKMDKYISVKDIVTNKYIEIHKELFNTALIKYIQDVYSNIDIDDFFNNHIITESNFTKYCSPSSAIIKNNEFPFETIEVDLSKYWGEYVFNKKEDKSINIDPNNNYAISEINYIDYMRNKITKINRYTGIQYRVSLDNETGNTPLSDSASISNTFTNLYGKSK